MAWHGRSNAKVDAVQGTKAGSYKDGEESVVSDEDNFLCFDPVLAGPAAGGLTPNMQMAMLKEQEYVAFIPDEMTFTRPCADSVQEYARIERIFMQELDELACTFVQKNWLSQAYCYVWLRRIIHMIQVWYGFYFCPEKVGRRQIENAHNRCHQAGESPIAAAGHALFLQWCVVVPII